MKTLLKVRYLFFFVIVFFSEEGICQEYALENASNTKMLDAAREIIRNARTCALITLDKEGGPRARTMDPFSPDADFNVWFGTNSKSRKVDQIKNDSRVTIYYFDHKTEGYVLIYGTAELIKDSAEKENHWKKEWEDFYPNKSDNYLLIKVSPIWMEVLSSYHGIYNDPITWQPPVIVFDKNKY